MNSAHRRNRIYPSLDLKRCSITYGHARFSRERTFRGARYDHFGTSPHYGINDYGRPTVARVAIVIGIVTECAQGRTPHSTVSRPSQSWITVNVGRCCPTVRTASESIGRSVQLDLTGSDLVRPSFRARTRVSKGPSFTFAAAGTRQAT